LKGIPQGRYTKELREEVIKLVLGGVSCAKAAKRLSFPKSTLANWVKAAKAGKLGDIGKSYRPLTEIECCQSTKWDTLNRTLLDNHVALTSSLRHGNNPSSG
jgi:transposase-like protein